MTAEVIGVEAVLIGGLQMVKRVLSAADIERIAICEEGLAAELLDQIDHGAGVVRTQIG